MSPEQLVEAVRFIPTLFKEAWLIEPERQEDERGFFARTWCQRELKELGLDSDLVQCSISFNRIAGTLRGMHFQVPPYEETKIVRCTQGRIFDVIVDLRTHSKTYGKYQSFELSAENRLAIYVPKGFAHGFQTLVSDSEVSYQMSTFFQPGSGSGFYFADPNIGIAWPLPVEAISTKDQDLEPFAWKVG